MIFTLPGGSFLSPPTPSAPPAPIDRAAIAEEAARQRAKELRARRGRASTVLTGAEGTSQDDTNVQRPTLLGQ